MFSESIKEVSLRLPYKNRIYLHKQKTSVPDNQVFEVLICLRMYSRRESNPHSEESDFESDVSTNSTT